MPDKTTKDYAVADHHGSGSAFSLRTFLFAAIGVLASFFIAVTSWSALAPLHSASIASGVVAVESHRKKVQHQDGGIIHEVLVQEGDLVEAGEVLVRLDATRAQHEVDLARHRYLVASVRASRLRAERDNHAGITWSAAMDAGEGAGTVLELQQSESEYLVARQKRLTSEISILQHKNSGAEADMKGLRAVIDSLQKQQLLIAEESRAYEKLHKQGFEGKTRLLHLQREREENRGVISEHEASIVRLQNQIHHHSLSIQHIRNTYQTDVQAQLNTAIAETDDALQRLQSFQDVLAQTTITAPVGGTVVNVQVAGAGQVVSSAEPMLDIVPDRDRLIVEAKIKPQDIDSVYAGLQAEVRFTAFNQRTTLPTTGVVLTVSADTLIDDRSTERYYLARIEMSGETGEVPDKLMQPGMTAEVLILTGERSMLEYVMQPLVHSFNRSMREN